ncbi:hypothetical protein [Hymenobacter daecheongensis]|uniref:hypothetical protein n=1 Tax=Hymenobacter daecheongensis TaxID=496053 RepID=UPI001161383F|nr:hypothetical protein [Hymenobacter daecheongensis]
MPHQIFTANFNSHQPVSLTIDVQSTNLVSHQFWYRLPGENTWIEFGSSRDGANTSGSRHTYNIDPLLPPNTTLRYWLLFDNLRNISVPYDTVVTLNQAGNEVHRFMVQGSNQPDQISKQTADVTLV